MLSNQHFKIKSEPLSVDESYIKTECDNDGSLRMSHDGVKTTNSDPGLGIVNKRENSIKMFASFTKLKQSRPRDSLCKTCPDERYFKIKLESIKIEQIDVKTEESTVNLDTSNEMERIKKKPFKCETCDYQFAQKSTLKTHMKTHTGERPFECETCHCQFSVKGNLFRHMKTHTGERPFKCEQCDSQFSLKNTLKKHMRIHTGEKPFECETCNSQFSQLSTLKDHMKIHTGEKPFQCGKCNCQFSWKSNLYRHLKSHTGEKVCKICNCHFL